MKRLELKPTEENIVKTIEKDIFNRNNELRCFYNLLISQEDGCTIAIDGKWGSGKTFFIKQEIMLINAMNPMNQDERQNLDIIKNKIMKKEEQKYDEIRMNMKPVYYDAWQNDNDIDPIVSLICEISKQTKEFVQTKKLDLIKAGTAIVDYFMKTNISDIYNSNKGDNYFEYLIYRKDLEDDFKDFFNNLCNENCNRIVIFIDELDRCKPSYAVKLLEQVKHYMDDDRITFVFALNTLELQHTIRQFYGYGFDANRYLDRFFDIRASLTTVDINKYYIELGELDDDIIDGRCERNGQEYDDHFTFDAGLISFEDLENISTAFFKYKSQIFWVDIKSDIYEEISTWSKRNVIMAGDLQAIYVHDCNIDFGEPLETYSYNREYNFK